MIKITIAGLCGRMGQMIAQCASEDSDIVLVSGIEYDGHPSLGKNISELVGNKDACGTLEKSLDACNELGDVIIDFSHHTSTLPLLKQAVAHRMPYVIGTTGFSADENAQIEQLALQIPCVKSPNMSVGMNILFKLVGQAAKAVGNEYDIEIVEAHHRFKKDAPSGTANKLLEIAADASGRNMQKDTVYGREGNIGERVSSEIGVFAIRGGDIVGDHTVIFAGLGERLELTHRAHTRANFARGALTAARFIVGKDDGLYDMQDVLGLK